LKIDWKNATIRMYQMKEKFLHKKSTKKLKK